MNHRRGLDALVIGGGAVGATAALDLARQGLQVALVELREPPQWQAEPRDLRVFAIAADSAALLNDVGAWDAIRSRRAYAYTGMEVWDAASRATPIRFDAQRMGRPQLGWIVENSLIQDSLWRQLERSSVTCNTGAGLATLEQSATSVTVTLDNGLSLSAKRLIAADGANSAVRKWVNVSSTAADYGQRGIVCYVHHTDTNQRTCWQRFLPTGPLAFLPVDDYLSSIVWSVPDRLAAELLELGDAAFTARLRQAFDGPLGEMTHVSARAAFPLRRQLAHHFVNDRVALVGDAAHVVHPLAGQGVNIGFRDVLGLRSVTAQWDESWAWQRWARIRKSESAVGMYAFDGLNALFSNDQTALTLLRGPALGWVNRIPGATRALWKKAAGL